jgi:c-di-GMP-binding flagellar brake protein YcgR
MPTRKYQNELLDAKIHSEYLIYDRCEIAYLLRGLLQHKMPIRAYLSQSESFQTTLLALITVDDGAGRDCVVFDAGKTDFENAKILSTGRLICATHLSRVQIQFNAEDLILMEYEGAPAFYAPIPSQMLRLQRRQFFRLVDPSNPPLVVQLTLPGAGLEGEDFVYQARLVDISQGGVGLMIPPPDLVFAPGMAFPLATIELPDGTLVNTPLQIRSVFNLTDHDGTSVLRAGCQFVSLSNVMAGRIQRYILRAERERKALEANEEV